MSDEGATAGTEAESEDDSEGPKDWSFTSHVGADLRGIDLSGAIYAVRFSMGLT